MGKWFSKVSKREDILVVPSFEMSALFDKRETSYEYVFVVCCHGQRTPLTECTNLPKEESEDYGRMTAAGREQTVEMGRRLRSRYLSILTGQPGDVIATHNQNPCTEDSVRLILEGLDIPPTTPFKDNTDYMAIYEKSLAQHYDTIMASAGHGRFRTIQNMVDFVRDRIGSPSTSQNATLLCLDSLRTHVVNGHPMPDWAVADWDDILSADRKVFEMALEGIEKPLAEYILGEILDTLVVMYERGHFRQDKMHIFTVSDMNLFAVLKLLNRLYDSRPNFGAALFIEVFRDAEGLRVRILFGGDVVPLPLRLDRLSNPCPLANFVAEISHLLGRQ
ncbi:uncharacterized protein LOC135389849 [Ornithodoros turicata]|uniref:uncharacterized protein LOC135389849 n=1 Tax=Ornithodoros turicata TaxID=34597 RepID=UPI00313A236E